MREFPLRSGIPSYVLLLEAPTEVFRTTLEGHQRSRIETQLEQFVSGEPESAFESENKFPPPLRQLKDRGGNVRAFGTWYRGKQFDLLVVQAIYRKRDEDTYLARQSAFAERGVALREHYGTLDHDALQRKIEEWRDRNDLVVFTAEDF